MKRTTKSIVITTLSMVTVVVCVFVMRRPATGEDSPKVKESRRKFKQLDKNNSGALEREEFPGDDEAFRRADLDGNGSINFKEALELIIQTEAEKVFMRLDKDRDGYIRKDELTKDSERKNFEAVDTNKDQKLSGAEVVAAYRRAFKGENKSTDKATGKAKKPSSGKLDLKEPPTWDKIKQYYDKDNDGKVEVKEIRSRVTGRTLDNLDKDGDGFINKAEYQEARQRLVRLIRMTREVHQLATVGLKDMTKKLQDIDIDGAEKRLEQFKKQLNQWLRVSTARDY